METSPPANPRRASYIFAPTSDPQARKACNPTSPAFFSGSSFKPLHLTHPPWVSAYLRADQEGSDCQKFRLPYAVQHAHLQGDSNSTYYHKSPTLPPTRQIPVLDKRTSSPPSPLSDTNANDIELFELSDSESKPTESSPNNEEQAQVEQSEIDYFSLPIASSRCPIDGTESSNSSTFRSGPDNSTKRIPFDLKMRTTENRTPSESQPSMPISPPANPTRRSSTNSRRFRSNRKRINTTFALPITAFQSELIGEITIAEDAFGYSPRF